MGFYYVLKNVTHKGKAKRSLLSSVGVNDLLPLKIHYSPPVEVCHS